MEVHGYTPQGVRVLTPAPQGSQPEILERAASINLPGLKKEEILELKLDGQRDEELYRLLVLSLCESFHGQLPLLFPAVREDLELLLPDMLLRSDSLLSWFVQGLGDEEWQEIEVLGWLYQYYISELKAEYMARKSAYKKEEIPAVTQLFTPKWIVQYLVHNSLGRTWLLHYPESGLKAKMPYYIEPAQQEPEVEAELKRLFSGSLNPEDIKLLDPAMGSGHILVTAYEVLREIYLERGYQHQQCARLILEKNLYGLDIDLRASEIACFALIMKAREDDSTILATGKGLRLNLLSFRDCAPEDRADLIQSLNPAKEQREYLQAVLSLFEQGTLFGSLIQVPEHLVGKLNELAVWLEKVVAGQDLLASKAAESALVFVRLAQVLGQKYDQVVSNPPYMGNKFLSPALKAFLGNNYEGYEKDLFSAFIVRNLMFSKEGGQLGFMSPFVWMFISSYEELRNKLIDDEVITSLIQLEYSGFDGATVPICTFTLQRSKVRSYKGNFVRLSDFKGAQNQAPKTLEAINDHDCGWFYIAKPDDFRKIPGRPIAFWISEIVIDSISKSIKQGTIAEARMGLATGDNARYLRFWFETKVTLIGFNMCSRESALQSKKRWFPYVKGGPFRKWFGNNEHIVNWENDGFLLQNTMHASGERIWAHNFNLDHIFQDSLTWSDITSGLLSVRFNSSGFLFDGSGTCAFYSDSNKKIHLLGY